MQRKETKQINVGGVLIGGDAPVSVQSMTSGYTYDVDTCVAEIHKLADAGADIVRVAVPKREDTKVLPEILKQVSVPIVADVHFHYKRALEAIEVGVHKIRLNPGNISDTDQVHKVIDACNLITSGSYFVSSPIILIIVLEGSMKKVKITTVPDLNKITLDAPPVEIPWKKDEIKNKTIKEILEDDSLLNFNLDSEF